MPRTFLRFQSKGVTYSTICKKFFQLLVFNGEFPRPDRLAIRWSTMIPIRTGSHAFMHRNLSNPYNSFSMFNIACGIDRGHVRATTSKMTSHNMAAILQLLPTYTFDNRNPCYGQLTSVETRYSLTTITWPFQGLSFRTHRLEVAWFLKGDCWPSAGFRLDWSAEVNL